MRAHQTAMFRASAALAMSVLIGASPEAQPRRMGLQVDPEQLSPEVRVLYLEASEHLDHADYIDAVRELSLAADLAPERIEIQTAFVQTAWENVRLGSFSSEEALQIGHRAHASLSRILMSPNVPPQTRSIAAMRQAELEVLLRGAEATLAQRTAASRQYVQRMTDVLERQAVRDQQAREQIREERERSEQEGSSSGANQGNNFQANPFLVSRRH